LGLRAYVDSSHGQLRSLEWRASRRRFCDRLRVREE
jgi:hypothetical protein